MKNSSRVISLMVSMVVIFQCGSLWAADSLVTKATNTSKSVSTTTTNVGDAAQAERDIARATAPKTVSGTGYTPTAEGNKYPYGSVTPDPLPANVAVSGGQCPQAYRCVVPHGTMLLATCFVKTGAPGESSSCSEVQPKCQQLEGVRRSGGTLSAADDAYFDHNCKS